MGRSWQRGCLNNVGRGGGERVRSQRVRMRRRRGGSIFLQFVDLPCLGIKNVTRADGEEERGASCPIALPVGIMMFVWGEDPRALLLKQQRHVRLERIRADEHDGPDEKMLSKTEKGRNQDKTRQTESRKVEPAHGPSETTAAGTGRAGGQIVASNRRALACAYSTCTRV